MSIDKRKALTLLLFVVVAAVAIGLVLNGQSTANVQKTTNEEQISNYSLTAASQQVQLTSSAPNTVENMSFGMLTRQHGWKHRRGWFGPIEVSEEFKENVVNIAKNDTDVQNLLNEGYNITRIKPLIKSVVDGDGTVVTKATGATLMLEKDTTGYAYVWIDLGQGKVTRMEILTRTVIEKP